MPYLCRGRRDRSRHELRGCLGTFTPKPLGEALSEYAIARYPVSTISIYRCILSLSPCSATRDSRFAPIAKREVHQLHVGVSLLTDFEQVADPLDWTPGLHGIIVEFMVESRKYRATYLPEIALEQGWSRKETLTSLVKKAGFNGRPTDRLLGSLRVQRYKSTKFTLSYDDYIG